MHGTTPDKATIGDYDHAIEEERRLWELVKGRHPGTKEHEPEDWAKWMEAAERLRLASPKLSTLWR